MNNRIKSSLLYSFLLLIAVVGMSAASSGESETLSKTQSIVAERKALLDSI